MMKIFRKLLKITIFKIYVKIKSGRLNPFSKTFILKSCNSGTKRDENSQNSKRIFRNAPCTIYICIYKKKVIGKIKVNIKIDLSLVKSIKLNTQEFRKFLLFSCLRNRIYRFIYSLLNHALHIYL